MASFILSFVGNQDPVSDNTREEGSIVTLIRHLLTQQCEIGQVLLLYTTTTADRAELTQGWLEDAPLQIPADRIQRMAVSEALSNDPVNLLLAAQEARKAIEQVMPQLSGQDTMEFNASSGTPVMKSAWSILQAAGHAPNSRVWQVRNPQEMQPGQARVFQTNVDTLKKEFEIKVAKRQINDYNYSGALVTLQASQLDSEPIAALLEYGRCRLAFDYDRAHASLQPVLGEVDDRWHKEISTLRRREYAALAQEACFNALTKLKNRAYAEFLERLSSFQETALRALVQRHISINLKTSQKCSSEAIWQELQQVEQGKLYQYLQSYQIPGSGKTLYFQGFVNVTVMRAILSYYPGYATVEPLLEELRQLIQGRNDLVHGLEGVSAIADEEKIVVTMRQILKQITKMPANNPFDDLNQQLSKLLDAV
jgi:hypothetical protein